jgi:hypothetical protein
MFNSPRKENGEPPEGENHQDGDTKDKAEGLHSNQFTIYSMRAMLHPNSGISSQTSRSEESLPAFTSTLAIELPKVTAVVLETSSR